MDDKRFRQIAHELLRPKDLRGPGLDIIMRNQHEKTFGVRCKNPARPCEDCDQVVENRVILYYRTESDPAKWERICNICRKTWSNYNPLLNNHAED